jgi:hypothetical protein
MRLRARGIRTQRVVFTTVSCAVLVVVDQTHGGAHCSQPRRLDVYKRWWWAVGVRTRRVRVKTNHNL